MINLNGEERAFTLEDLETLRDIAELIELEGMDSKAEKLRGIADKLEREVLSQ